MKLTRIRATNFKGFNFDVALFPQTIFVGANFAGKTARADAIRLLLLGYLPELGKAPRATFGLSSGAEMEVYGEFDDGQKMRRRFFLKGDTVKTEVELPACFGGLGGPTTDLAVMLDASTYFGLSDRARIDYVFGLIRLGEDWKPAAILTRLAKTFPDALEMVAKLEKFADPDSTAQMFVDAAIEATADEWKQAKAYGVRMEQTIQGLSSLRASDLISAENISSLEDRRALIARQITDLQERKGAKIGAFTAMKAGRHRREEIERQSRFGDKNRLEMVALKEKLALIEQQRAALGDAPNMTKLRDAAAEASGQVARTDIHLDSAQRSLAAIEKQQGEMIAAAACPCCGADGEGWKEKRFGQLRAQFEEAIKVLDAEKIKSASARAANREAQGALRAADDAAGVRAALFDSKRDVEDKISRLAPDISRLEILAEELTRLPAEDPQLVTDVEMLQTEINVLTEEGRDIDGTIKEQAGRQAEVKRLAEAEKERDKAKLDQARAADLGTHLREIQGEMVAAAFTPLLETADKFYATILRAPLAYHDGEIGMWRGGAWVAHHTFSGTEKALTYAAIQAALSAGAPCRVMIVDELGRLDTGNIDRLVDAVDAAAKAGLIDNFIGIDAGRVSQYQYLLSGDRSGFKVIDINQEGV